MREPVSESPTIEVIDEVPSNSDPKLTYQIQRTPYGFRCSCPGFYYRGDCRHMKMWQESHKED